MKILAIEKAAKELNEVKLKSLLVLEVMQVWNLYKKETLREIYFTRNDNRAVLILECESEIIAEKILNSLPLVEQNQIQFEIIPLKAYDGFERLFNVS